MAITTVRTDDLNDEPDAVEVLFSYKGVDYTIDLGPTNQKEIDAAMEEWIAGARVVPKSTVSGAKRTRSANRGSAAVTDGQKVREWARQNGFTGPDGGPLPKRGRISAEILEAYEKANPTG